MQRDSQPTLCNSTKIVVVICLFENHFSTGFQKLLSPKTSVPIFTKNPTLVSMSTVVYEVQPQTVMQELNFFLEVVML